ncbi:MAG: calcium-binding protein, partial [Rubrivivax sp.]|nr:calcium-binding protein [Rubrivivax sp.]
SYVRVGNNLEVRIAGAADKLIVQNWYLGSQYQVEEFKYVDGTTVTNSQVAGLLSAMATFAGSEGAETEAAAFTSHWRFPDVQLAIP